jgi:hypothetical protein
MELPFAALHQLCVPLLDRLETLPVPQRNALSMAFGLSAGTSLAEEDRHRSSFACLASTASTDLRSSMERSEDEVLR